MRQRAGLPCLEPREPVVDTFPARRDQLDHEREIVDARVPLCEQVALEPLEPSDRLVQEASDLGQLTRDR